MKHRLSVFTLACSSFAAAACLGACSFVYPLGEYGSGAAATDPEDGGDASALDASRDAFVFDAPVPPAAHADLAGIHFSGTASGKTEANILSRASTYAAIVDVTSIQLPTVDDTWAFVSADYDKDGIKDLYALDLAGSSGATEITILSGASHYQTVLLQTKTALGPTNRQSWAFAAGDFNGDGVGDLYAIELDADGGTTEVHILSGAPSFQTFLAHDPSGLGPSNPANWAFLTGDYDGDGKADLYALSLKGASHSTEVHILSAVSGFKTFLLHTPTSIPESDNISWAFAGGDYDSDGKIDIYMLSLAATSKSTEVYILGGASHFATTLLHEVTALPNETTSAWGFVTE